MGRDEKSLRHAHLTSDATRSASGRYHGHVRSKAADKEEQLAMNAEQVGTVLVVEDDPHLRPQLVGMVERTWKLRAIEAADYRTALALARAHRPELAIIDLCLPGGGNGMDLIRIMRAEGNFGRLVLITGMGDDDDLVDAMLAGASYVVRKPFDAKRLGSKLFADGVLPRGDDNRKPVVCSLELVNWEHVHRVHAETGSILETGRLIGVDPKTVRKWLRMPRPLR